MACILKSDRFVVKALKYLALKVSIANSINKTFANKFKVDYSRLQQNLLRSVTICYSHNVIDKRNYMNINHASKVP